MIRTRITDRLTFLEPADMRQFKACAGILIQGSRKVAIDANMGPETADLLCAEKPREAVISHYHLDHSIWGTAVQEHTDAEVFVPSGEDRYLTDRQFFLDQTAGPYGLVDAWRRFSVDECDFHGLRSCRTYDPGDSFSDRSIRIACIDTRGHSPSHRSFYFPEERVLFTGDLGIDRFGPWYGWRDCDLGDLVAAIFTLRGLPVDVLLTSHGGMLTCGIRAAWDRALKCLVDRERVVALKLDQGLPPEAIVAQGIFFPHKERVPEPMRSFLTMWDTAMFGHHRRLLHQGGLTRLFPELGTIVSDPTPSKEPA